jgi:predicted nucleic acid-binding protein
MAFVLDGSMTMTWCFEDERTDATQAVLSRLATESAHMPWIWPFEIANTMLIGERRGRLTQAQSASFVTRLEGLAIVFEDDQPLRLLGAAVALGRVQNLSGYDATYLELALRLGLPLATLDARLRDAATRVGVPLLA